MMICKRCNRKARYVRGTWKCGNRGVSLHVANDTAPKWCPLKQKCSNPACARFVGGHRGLCDTCKDQFAF